MNKAQLLKEHCGALMNKPLLSTPNFNEGSDKKSSKIKLDDLTQDELVKILLNKAKEVAPANVGKLIAKSDGKEMWVVAAKAPEGATYAIIDLDTGDLDLFTESKANEGKMSDLFADLTESGWYVFDSKGDVVQGPVQKKNDVKVSYIQDDSYQVLLVTADDLPECKIVEGKIAAVVQGDYIGNNAIQENVNNTNDSRFVDNPAKTYAIYNFDPRENPHSYLQGYFSPKRGDTLEKFVTRSVGNFSAKHAFVFDKTVSKGDKIEPITESSVPKAIKLLESIKKIK